VFTRRIEIALPIVSANMDTISESAMAIAVAGAGGIGVLHRFLPIEQQAAEVSRVKRFLSVVVTDPYRISPGDTVAEARAAAARNGVTGLLVADGDRFRFRYPLLRDALHRSLTPARRRLLHSRLQSTVPVRLAG
jgi:IMP dehydrogenase